MYNANLFIKSWCSKVGY